MKSVFVVVAAVGLLGIGVAAQAWVNIQTVAVGDAGNAADTRYANPGYGAVGYNYNIGKYEVTAAQYTEFLNAKAKTDPHGLYNTYMGSYVYGCQIQRNGASDSYTYSVASDWANRPVNFVSYWDACRFANWLNNGQGNGDTETGAYTLNSYNGDDGRTIVRNTGARWFLPSEDEWYKAAYYKGGGTNASYWDYPTQSDSLPQPRGNQVPPPADPGNSANYGVGGNLFYTTNVGEFENSASAYGTFDQGGNIYEWNEALIVDGYYACRGARGGSFQHSSPSLLASHRSHDIPTNLYDTTGFRVAAAVPEPSSLMALSAAGLGLLLAQKRRRG